MVESFYGLFEVFYFQVTSIKTNLTLIFTYGLNADFFFSVLYVNLLSNFNFIIDRHPHPLCSLSQVKVMVDYLRTVSTSPIYTLQDGEKNMTASSTNTRGASNVINQGQLFEENTLDFRAQRNQNPVFKPDFKSGNFFSRDDFSRKPLLLTTISDLTKGMRRPVWFLSDTYSSGINSLKSNYLNLVNASINPLTGDSKVSDTFIQNPYGIFQTFHLFTTSKVFSTPQGELDITYPFINQR